MSARSRTDGPVVAAAAGVLISMSGTVDLGAPGNSSPPTDEFGAQRGTKGSEAHGPPYATRGPPGAAHRRRLGRERVLLRAVRVAPGVDPRRRRVVPRARHGPPAGGRDRRVRERAAAVGARRRGGR